MLARGRVDAFGGIADDIDDLGLLGAGVVFIGPVDDKEKNVLLNQAVALLIPAIDSEAFNTTMLEANACGCPVISYNKFCFKEQKF